MSTPDPDDKDPTPANGDGPAPVKEPGDAEPLRTRWLQEVRAVAEEHPLTRYRRRHGQGHRGGMLPQGVVADRFPTSKATISRIEAGTLNPTLDLLRRLDAATDGEVTADACIDWLERQNRRELAA